MDSIMDRIRRMRDDPRPPVPSGYDDSDRAAEGVGVAAAVPTWLRACSSLFFSSPDDANGDNVGAAELLAELPVCDLECANGVLYYRVLRMWCVPWHLVPRPQFLKAWRSVDPRIAAALTERYKMYKSELAVEAVVA